MGKDCGKHGFSANFNVKFTVTITVSITLSFSAGLGSAYLLLRPNKPSFYIQNATIYQFNLSSSSPDCLVSFLMHVSISSVNPNGRVGVYYDRLDAHAAYMDQRITLPSALPAGYQGHKDVSVWEPYLSGVTLPVAPHVVDALRQDQAAGLMRIHVKSQGRVRWKVGRWVSGHYHLRVSCAASFYFQYAGGDAGVVDPAAVRFQRATQCSVHV